VLQEKGRNIPFVNNVTYLDVTFDRRMTRRHHVEKIVAKALGKYVRTYFLFRGGCLSTNIKFTLYKALIRSVMTQACPTWEYAADTQLLKLQRLQNIVLSAVGKFDRWTAIYELYVAFKILTCMTT
jgi:hypothetical protein